MTERILNIEFIEDDLCNLFGGDLRKDGVSLVVQHSLNVGRRLLGWYVDPIVVFAGYYHDVPEDIQDVANGSHEEKMQWLTERAIKAGLSKDDATLAATVTLMCCYTPDEYRLPKMERKLSACSRWRHAPLEVMLVKASDIIDNRECMSALSQKFMDDYDFWAYGLLSSIQYQFQAVPPTDHMNTKTLYDINMNLQSSPDVVKAPVSIINLPSRSPSMSL